MTNEELMDDMIKLKFKELQDAHDDWEMELLYGITDRREFVKMTIQNHPEYILFNKQMMVFDSHDNQYPYESN